MEQSLYDSINDIPAQHQIDDVMAGPTPWSPVRPCAWQTRLNFFIHRADGLNLAALVDRAGDADTLSPGRPAEAGDKRSSRMRRCHRRCRHRFASNVRLALIESGWCWGGAAEVAV